MWHVGRTRTERFSYEEEKRRRKNAERMRERRAKQRDAYAYARIVAATESIPPNLRWDLAKASGPRPLSAAPPVSEIYLDLALAARRAGMRP